MFVRSNEVRTLRVLLGVKCPFHPLVPLGMSIQGVSNVADESNIITRPTICVHSSVQLRNSILAVHSHFADPSYHSDNNGMAVEVPVTRLTDQKMEELGISHTNIG